MARDYGNKRSAPHRKSAPHQFLVISVAFLLGYLTATLLDPQTISTWMNTQVLANHEKPKLASKSEPQREQTPPKPKFEFYTLLTNEKDVTQPATHSNSHVNHPATAKNGTAAAKPSPVSNGTAAVALAANNTAKPKTAVNQAATVKIAEGKPSAAVSNGRGLFLVQVAAFKARKDAEHLQGLLILKGFDVKVVPITNAHGNWFRVVVGPYANRILAQKAQLTLAKNERLRGMVTSAGG
ncbi:SPOR domain-containing protein [Legionella worsleiensis]|uniref:Sporulation domain-containing protein n=1 Tax=Legionella worsleiensis TaxID=45076 RepID=A0A0W1AIV0_9GAMM|nr:SPOR domain-containing protein [Legionella worsleiensis]KTD81290.1 Sporulation domain-containing protein [Legionella worsleiensis]STY30821.1 Sporulation domain-containing protein [Legionella worsleiensis]